MIDTVIRHGNSLVVAGPLQSSPLVCFLVISNNHPSLSLSDLLSPHFHLSVNSQESHINVYIKLYDLSVELRELSETLTIKHEPRSYHSVDSDQVSLCSENTSIPT